MDSRLLTMMEGHTGILECGGNFTPVPTGIRGTRGSRGVGQGLLARRRFGFGDSPVPNQALR